MTEVKGLDNVKPLFQLDILLPSQYFERSQPKSESIPEERLLLALLMDALHSFQKYCFSASFLASPFWDSCDPLSPGSSLNRPQPYEAKMKSVKSSKGTLSRASFKNKRAMYPDPKK